MFIVMLVGFVVYVNSVVEVFIYVVFIACICYYVVWWFYIVGGCLYLAVRVGLLVVVGMLVAWLDGAGCGLVFWFGFVGLFVGFVALVVSCVGGRLVGWIAFGWVAVW